MSNQIRWVDRFCNVFWQLSFHMLIIGLMMITVKSNFHTWDHLVVCYSFFPQISLITISPTYVFCNHASRRIPVNFLRFVGKDKTLFSISHFEKEIICVLIIFHFLKASAGSKSSWNYQWRKAKQWTKQICSSRNQNWTSQRWVSEVAHWIFFHLVSCWWSCSWLYLEMHLLFSPLKRTPRFAQSQITL